MLESMGDLGSESTGGLGGFMGGLGGGGLTSSSSADGDNMFGDNSFDYRNASPDSKVVIVAIAFVSFVTGLIVAKAVK